MHCLKHPPDKQIWWSSHTFWVLLRSSCETKYFWKSCEASAFVLTPNSIPHSSPLSTSFFCTKRESYEPFLSELHFHRGWSNGMPKLFYLCRSTQKQIQLTEPDSHPLSVFRSDRLGKQPHRIAGISLESCIHSKGLSIQTIFAMSRFLLRIAISLTKIQIAKFKTSKKN